MEILLTFGILIAVIWFAGYFPAKMAGWEKHYTKYSKQTAKAALRPVTRQLRNNKKFFWGVLGGIVLVIYILQNQ